jgi:hypothetical protein
MSRNPFANFHFHTPSPKMDYVEDLNELIVEFTKDPTNRLTKPERIVRGDVYRLIWALEEAKKQLDNLRKLA